MGEEEVKDEIRIILHYQRGVCLISFKKGEMYSINNKCVST